VRDRRGLAAALRRVHDRDRALTDDLLLRTPFHSGFWATRAIRAALASRARATRGTLLDVGCGTKPYAAFFASHVNR
jgi:hypothetical protein